jgi:6-phosphofructokinase 1
MAQAKLNGMDEQIEGQGAPHQLLLDLDFSPNYLGPCKIQAPQELEKKFMSGKKNFIPDNKKILYQTDAEVIKKYYTENQTPPAFELAGPREKIYFDPSKIKAAIVTCGGLCPGLNDVIRAIVMELIYIYNTKTIYGIRYGYEGFIPSYGHEPLMLDIDAVRDIHTQGGTILGTSRGSQDMEEIVDCLERMNINMLFAIGGDGTLRGAHAIQQVIAERGLKISVIGIPKTIDNDINYVEKTFGFETAFSFAATAISSAHVEAKGARNGIGLVKLMGRHSGYIAAKAALAMNDVNIVLIPEVPFKLKGPNGLFAYLQKRLERSKHAVIVVAEGAGQEFFIQKENERDASGNLRLKDIGLFLRDELKAYFKQNDFHANVKYIDPSYIIRSIPANANDSILCGQLGQNAVHAAMAGRTDICIGIWNDHFIHLPLQHATKSRKVVSQESTLWQSVLEATGQPARFE